MKIATLVVLAVMVFASVSDAGIFRNRRCGGGLGQGVRTLFHPFASSSVGGCVGGSCAVR